MKWVICNNPEDIVEMVHEDPERGLISAIFIDHYDITAIAGLYDESDDVTYVKTFEHGTNLYYVTLWCESICYPSEELTKTVNNMLEEMDNKVKEKQEKASKEAKKTAKLFKNFYKNNKNS